MYLKSNSHEYRHLRGLHKKFTTSTEDGGTEQDSVYSINMRKKLNSGGLRRSFVQQNQ